MIVSFVAGSTKRTLNGRASVVVTKSINTSMAANGCNSPGSSAAREMATLAPVLSISSNCVGWYVSTLVG